MLALIAKPRRRIAACLIAAALATAGCTTTVEDPGEGVDQPSERVVWGERTAPPIGYIGLCNREPGNLACRGKPQPNP